MNQTARLSSTKSGSLECDWKCLWLQDLLLPFPFPFHSRLQFPCLANKKTQLSFAIDSWQLMWCIIDHRWGLGSVTIHATSLQANIFYKYLFCFVIIIQVLVLSLFLNNFIVVFVLCIYLTTVDLEDTAITFISATFSTSPIGLYHQSIDSSTADVSRNSIYYIVVHVEHCYHFICNKYTVLYVPFYCSSGWHTSLKMFVWNQLQSSSRYVQCWLSINSKINEFSFKINWIILHW